MRASVTRHAQHMRLQVSIGASQRNQTDVLYTARSHPLESAAFHGAHPTRTFVAQEGYRSSDVDEAASFWSEALGRPVDPDHPSSGGNGAT